MTNANLYNLIVLMIFLSTTVCAIAYIAIRVSFLNNKEINDSSVGLDLSKYLFTQTPEDKGSLYDKVLNLIDSFILEAVDVYFRLNSDMEEEHYIDSTESKELTNYVLASVMKNMTPEVKKIIASVYNYKDDKELFDFIKLRVKLQILTVMINVNKPLQH